MRSFVGLLSFLMFLAYLVMCMNNRNNLGKELAQSFRHARQHNVLDAAVSQATTSYQGLPGYSFK